MFRQAMAPVLAELLMNKDTEAKDMLSKVLSQVSIVLR